MKPDLERGRRPGTLDDFEETLKVNWRVFRGSIPNTGVQPVIAAADSVSRP